MSRPISSRTRSRTSALPDCPHGTPGGLVKTRRGQLRCPLCRVAQGELELAPAGPRTECEHGVVQAALPDGRPTCALCRVAEGDAQQLASRLACPHGLPGGARSGDDGQVICLACRRQLEWDRRRAHA
jgi:hypothetical protein